MTLVREFDGPIIFCVGEVLANDEIDESRNMLVDADFEPMAFLS